MNSKKEILLIRCFWSLLLFLCWLLPLSLAKAQYTPSSLPAHLDTAITYFGPKELQKENYGPDIKRFLNSVGLPQGNPYCAAFVSYCMTATQSNGTGSRVLYPKKRTALASKFITDKSIEAKKVRRKQISVPAGWIGIHRKGNTIFGHAWFVLLPWHGPTGITIEANTSTGAYGNQRDGQGVWIRQRTIWPTNYFRITNFTPVYY